MKDEPQGAAADRDGTGDGDPAAAGGLPGTPPTADAPSTADAASGSHASGTPDESGARDAPDASEAPDASDAPDAPDTSDASDASDAGKPRLTRAREDQKVLAGVCAGAGRYFGVDPVIFRTVLAVLSLTGGIGLIIYGMGWLVIPQEGERQSEAHRLLSGRVEGAPLTAVLMALVGCGLYASMIGNGSNQAFSLILLTATAGAVYWSQQRHRLQAAGEAPSVAAGAVADAPPAVQAPPDPGSTPSWWRDPLSPLSKEPPPYLWGPDDGPDDAGDREAWKQRKAAARRERSWVFGSAVFLLALLALGLGTGISYPYLPAAVSAEIGLAAVLGVLGTAFVVASFAGRARGGTVFFSLLTLAALISASALPKTGQGVRGTTWRPATAAAVQPRYERGTGTGTLDLTRLSLGGRTVVTSLRIGAGQAKVRLPRNATVELDYDLGIGEVVLPGKVNDGVQIKKSRHDRLTYTATPGTASAGTIQVEVTVGVGQLKVIR